MNDPLVDERRNVGGIIPLHFDVPGHALSLEAFVHTARAIESILFALDENSFENSLEPRLVLLPPEEGSWLVDLAIFFGGTGGLIHGLKSFLESDLGKAAIRGGTGKDPADWVEHSLAQGRANLSRWHAERKMRKLFAPEGISEAEASSSSEPTDGSTVDKVERDKVVAAVAATIPLLLLMPSETFEKVVPPTVPGRSLHKARNEFFIGCRADRTVRGVGFDHTDHFSLVRSQFRKQMVVVPDEPEPEWVVQRERFVVTSPNWDRRDTRRKWKGRDTRQNTRYFTIEDEQFWDLVLANEITSKPKVAMEVQVAYPKGSENRSGGRVLRVMAYSGGRLGPPLDENALNAILGKFEEDDSDDPPQADLFALGSH